MAVTIRTGPNVVVARQHEKGRRGMQKRAPGAELRDAKEDLTFEEKVGDYGGRFLCYGGHFGNYCIVEIDLFTREHCMHNAVGSIM